jgi:hypothetical protein
MSKSPLTAVLKTKDLDVIQGSARSPWKASRIALSLSIGSTLRLISRIHTPTVRQFFRIGITGKKAFYREGTSYRIHS